MISLKKNLGYEKDKLYNFSGMNFPAMQGVPVPSRVKKKRNVGLCVPGRAYVEAGVVTINSPNEDEEGRRSTRASPTLDELLKISEADSKNVHQKVGKKRRRKRKNDLKSNDDNEDDHPVEEDEGLMPIRYDNWGDVENLKSLFLVSVPRRSSQF